MSFVLLPKFLGLFPENLKHTREKKSKSLSEGEKCAYECVIHFSTDQSDSPKA